MKKNRDKSNQSDQQQQKVSEQQNTSNRNATDRSGAVHNSPGAVNTTEKKPFSHRTGDASNFGDRSYQED